MDPFLGEIRIVAFGYAPRGWALCDGTLLSISQNTALFSLLGTTFGGNGQTNFALPDFRGRAAIGAGQGQNLSVYNLGQQAGTETYTLNLNEMPNHTHGYSCSSDQASQTTPQNGVFAAPDNSVRARNIYNLAPDSQAAASMVEPAGSGQAHDNMQPYTAMIYAIAIEGIFPSRP